MTKTGHEFHINDHWSVHLKLENKPPDYVLRLRSDLGWFQRQYVRWVNKTKVQTLYEALRSWMATPEGAVYPDGMRRVDLEAAQAIERWVPRTYWLTPASQIDPGSRKALSHGPLFDSDRENLLVTPNGRMVEVARWLENHPIYRILGVAITVGGWVWAVISLLK